QNYKYQHGVKLSGVASQLSSQGYHPSGALSGSAHATLPTMSAQVPFAVAAAPNGLTQTPTSVPAAVTSLRNDPSSILHSSTSHPTNPGQSLFVHGFVNQQNMANQLSQNTLSPSFVTEPPTVAPSLQLGSYNTKHNAQLNGSHNPRALSHTPLSGAPTPATHPSYAAALPLHQGPTASHPSFYTNSTIQQPPGHLAPSGLPHGVVEFLPAMISADPNTAPSQFNATSFGQYATHYPSTYDPSVDSAYNQRIRHNTWAGLETNPPGHVHGPNRSVDPQPYDNTFDIGGAANSNNNATSNRGTLASDRTTSTVSQRGASDAHGQLSSTGYNINSAAPMGAQLPELLEFYGSLPVPDHWLSVCGRYSNSTLPLTGTGRTTKTDELGFDSRISQWNPIPPPPLTNQWSTKHASSMIPSGLKNNTQSSAVAPDTLGSRRIMDGSNRPQGSNFLFKGNEFGTHKIATTRASVDVSGTTRFRSTRTNQPAHCPKSAQNPKRIGSWRPVTSGTGLDSGKPVNHFSPTTDTSASSFMMPSGVECGWIMPSPLVDPNVMQNVAAAQSSGIRSHDTLSWSGQLANPLLLTMAQGQLDPASRSAKVVPSNQTLPFMDSNGMLHPRLPDPSSGVARFNHGLRLLRDVFPTRILVSTALVGAVIGRGGRTIRLITAKTGAQIDFKPETVLFSQFSLPSGGSVNPGNPRIPVCTVAQLSPTSKQVNESPNEMPKTDQADADTTPSTEDVVPPHRPKTPPNTATYPQRSSHSVGTPEHPRAAQLSRSQPVYLFGSREQCSAAVGEILSVCFRECVHGPSAPCLGLLISHQIYQQLLVGCGRRYFDLLQAATGARVSVTGTPVHLEPIDKQSNREKVSKKPTSRQSSDSPDRIIVVRGELAAICAAEAYISEQVRMITARDSVPVCLWPLLPHLPPLTPSPQSHSAALAAASTAATNSSGSPFDLPTLNRLALCVALMFWNPSTWNKLISYVSFGSTVPRGGNVKGTAPQSPLFVPDRRRTKSVNGVDEATRYSSDPCVGSPSAASDTNGSTVEHASLPPPETQSMAEADPEAESETASIEQKDEKLDQFNHEPTVNESLQKVHSPIATDNATEVNQMKARDGEEVSPATLNEENDLNGSPLSNTHLSGSAPVSPVARTPQPSPILQDVSSPPHSALLSFDVASLTYPGGKPLRDAKAALFRQTAQDRELLASLQQAIVTAVGPAACLSTSGLIYMRVSYHEAGALIGTRGCRIRQIMESTGAKIHVSKTRISEPYAMTKAYQRVKLSTKPKFETCMESTHSDDVGEEGVCASINQNVEPGHVTPSVSQTETTECEPNSVHKNPASMSDQSPSEIRTSRPSSQQATPPPPVDQSTEIDLKKSCPTHLIKVETKTESENPAQHSPNDPQSTVIQDVSADDASGKSSSQSGYRLVTLSGPLQAQLMAHWRIFQCLKSLRPREEKHEKVVCDNKPPASVSPDENPQSKHTKQDFSNSQPHAPESLRLATLVCIPYAFWYWLSVPNTTFEHPDVLDEDRRCANASALNWLQAEAQRRMRNRFPDCAQVKPIVPLRKPKNRVMARLRRGPNSGGAHAPAVTTAASNTSAPTVDDIVTTLWSDRSRAPIEIYADYETTQFLLGCLHHMHAIWLYGETVVQRTTAMSNQSALLSTPPSRRQQQPLIYPTARSGAVLHPTPGLRQAVPPGGDFNELTTPTASNGRGAAFDWSSLWWPWLPVAPQSRMFGGLNGSVQLSHQDGHGRYPRVRGPLSNTGRWQAPGRSDRPRFANDSAELLAAMMMMTSANTSRPSPLTSFNPAAFGHFPLIPTVTTSGISGSSIISNMSKAGQIQTGGNSSAALLFNPFPLTPSLADLPLKTPTSRLRWNDFSRTERCSTHRKGRPVRLQLSNTPSACEPPTKLPASKLTEKSIPVSNADSASNVNVASSSEQKAAFGDAAVDQK
ncbi:hypothetical protein FGIG_06886, partial [Fasciola gigantica]